MKTLLPRLPVARARMLGVWLQRRAEVSQLQSASCRYIILGSSSVTLRHPGVVWRIELEMNLREVKSFTIMERLVATAFTTEQLLVTPSTQFHVYSVG